MVLILRPHLEVRDKELIMYILFEKANATSRKDNIHYYDAMGYCTSEEEAMKWRDSNPDYRVYKYCPDKEIKMD